MILDQTYKPTDAHCATKKRTDERVGQAVKRIRRNDQKTGRCAMKRDRFIAIELWPFADSFDTLAAHPDESIRAEFERITNDSLADCDAKTARLQKLAARAEAVDA